VQRHFQLLHLFSYDTINATTQTHNCHVQQRETLTLFAWEGPVATLEEAACKVALTVWGQR